jgi:hypothetical protein
MERQFLPPQGGGAAVTGGGDTSAGSGGGEPSTRAEGGESCETMHCTKLRVIIMQVVAIASPDSDGIHVCIFMTKDICVDVSCNLKL